MEEIRVVMADDHSIVREGTRRILEPYPEIKILGEAGNGLEALKLIKELQPDVAILDIAMPGLNGIEITRQLAEISPTTKALILTAYDDDAYITALMEAGATGYVLKTVTGKELAEAVHAINDGQTVLHPAIARKLVQQMKSSQGARVSGETFTSKEMEVFRLIAQGLSNKEIAAELDLSVRAVEVRLTNIFNKLGVNSRMEAVLYGLSRGLLEPPRASGGQV